MVLKWGSIWKGCFELGYYLKNEEKGEAMENSVARTSQMEEAEIS